MEVLAALGVAKQRVGLADQLRHVNAVLRKQRQRHSTAYQRRAMVALHLDELVDLSMVTWLSSIL